MPMLRAQAVRPRPWVYLLVAVAAFALACGTSDPETLTPTTSPTPVPNPVDDLDLPEELRQSLRVIGEDGEIDEEEGQLLAALDFIAIDLIPPEIRDAYYTDDEILGYQKALANSVLTDGSVSRGELEALDDIAAFGRWNIARDVIAEGMVAEAALSEDWDGDGLANVDELASGTNPMNELEYAPDDLSERYLVLISGPDATDVVNWYAQNVLLGYHLAKMSGYKDDDVILLMQNHLTFDPDHVFKTRPGLYGYGQEPYGTFGGLDLLVEPTPAVVDYRDHEVTPANVITAIRALPSDGNDSITIMFTGHGSYSSCFGPGLRGTGSLWVRGNNFINEAEDHLHHYDLNEAFRSLAYGKLVYVQSSSHAEGTTANLDESPSGEITPPHNTVGVANNRVGVSKDPIWLGNYLEWLGGAKSILWRSSAPATGVHAVNYYGVPGPQYDGLSWAPWFNPFFYLPDREAETRTPIPSTTIAPPAFSYPEGC